jgi:hypothetical protein
MSQRLQVKGTQSAVPNTVGAASSFSEATCVRLVNNGSSGRTVTVAEDNSGSTTIGTFSLLAGQTEYLQKYPSNVVFVGGGTDVQGASVGLTN